VMADVGRGSVVAAGAVVIRAIPDRAVAGGVPARVLRHRDASPADANRAPAGERPALALARRSAGGS
jgi:serine acetyltransferase